MAFRFKREGDRIKHRVHMERMGMQPWIEDFKWRAVDWHYQFYMGPKARGAIMANQRLVPTLQDTFDKRSHGFVQRVPPAQAAEAEYSPRRTKYFTWTTMTPQAVPYMRTSNPFCPVTPNRTGWREYVEQKNVRGAVRVKSPTAQQHRVRHLQDPKPKREKHVVSGTDHTVPAFPRQD
mmetsp:Transcript_68754/g.182643  ORF Transcript_68754/g.182643 Transcript_68754/m.182643 type:complete len:178 (+) Transcript_68754:143-676(+)